MEDNEVAISATKATQIAINKLEATFILDADNISNLTKISELYLSIANLKKAERNIDKAMRLFRVNPSSCSLGLEIVDVALRFWKTNKYIKRDSVRLNISKDRSIFLSNILVVLNLLIKLGEASTTQEISFRIAYVKEQMGQVESSLAVLSDLITMQAMDAGVDLTFIIFKAAVILKHIGGHHSQAIEYLEFLLDDPPVNEGYSKTHVLAFLILVYEQSGKEYEILTERAYVSFLETYNGEISAGKRPITTQKKLEQILQKTPIQKCSEIWEMLGLQALERCEYILALEYLKHAVDKAPNKGKLIQTLAEICFILNETALCAVYAEKAFPLQPNSPELRNLLLTVAPEKWTDRLRVVAPTKDFVKKVEDDDQFGATIDLESPIKPVAKTDNGDMTGNNASEDNWISKLKSKANDLQKAVEQDGAAGLLAAMGLSKSSEQKAKEAVEKEKKRREKQQRKEQRAKRKEEAEQGKSPKKRDPVRDGPARPVKPEFNPESYQLINKLLTQPTNAHFYDESLQKLAEIREIVEREERERLEQKLREKALLSKKK